MKYREDETKRRPAAVRMEGKRAVEKRLCHSAAFAVSANVCQKTERKVAEIDLRSSHREAVVKCPLSVQARFRQVPGCL